MKTSTLLLIGIAALVAYFVLGKRSAATSSPTANPTGGKQNGAGTDLVNGLVGLATAAFGAVSSIAQSGQKTAETGSTAPAVSGNGPGSPPGWLDSVPGF